MQKVLAAIHMVHGCIFDHLKVLSDGPPCVFEGNGGILQVINVVFDAIAGSSKRFARFGQVTQEAVKVVQVFDEVEPRQTLAVLCPDKTFGVQDSSMVIFGSLGFGLMFP